MTDPKDLKTLGIFLMVVSIGMLLASAMLSKVALAAVGAACFTIAAATLAKSKSDS